MSEVVSKPELLLPTLVTLLTNFNTLFRSEESWFSSVAIVEVRIVEPRQPFTLVLEPFME